MFPSKVVIASKEYSLNQKLINLLRGLGWDDFHICDTVDKLLQHGCQTDQEILIFLFTNLAPSSQLLEVLASLRKNLQALLVTIFDPDQVDSQSIAKFGKLIDGFILLPLGKHSLTATLTMAKERRQRELDLLRSEEKFNSLFHKSAEPSLLLHNQIFIDCNQAALDNFRAERKDIIGKSPADLSPEIQPDGSTSIEKSKKYIDETLKSGFTQFEWLHRRLDNSVFLAEVTCTAIPYAGDLALVVKWRDITEVEHFKKSLELSEQRYRQLFETMLNGFALHEMIYDENHQPVDYRFLAINPAFEKLTGLSADTLIGKTVLEVLPNTEPYWIETYGKVASSGDPILIENYSRELDRYYRVFAFSPTRGQFATLFEDITLQKKNERYQSALLHLSEKIRQAYTTEEMVQTIIFTVSSILDIDTAAIALKSAENDFNFQIVFGIGKARDWIGAEFTKDQGISGYALRNKTPLFQNNVAESPYYIREYQHFYHPYVAVVPLISGEDTIGAFLLGRDKPFTDNDKLIITSMSELISNALQRMILQEKTQQTVDYLSALRKIDLTITLGRDLGERLSVLLEVVIEHQKVDAASIWLKEPQTDLYQLAAYRGFQLHEFQFLSTPDPGVKTDTRQLVHLKKEILKHALSGEFGQLIQNEAFTDYIGIPLITKKNDWGILQLWKRSEISPTRDWMNFLEMLAGQAAIAIEDIQLLTDLQYHINELQAAYDTTLQGWAKALEIRDAETQNHSHRVTQITLDLAKKLGVEESQLIHIRRGTLLHDIGKMGIPDAILNKPAPLTPEEWEVMRRHPQMAFDILSGIPFLKPALDIPYSHHEKWDGSGYPQGLKGEEIPLAARIFAVVDVWDALLSDRPYRPAWKKHEVITYLREQAGKHFDPKIVEAFIELISEEEGQDG